MLGLGEQTYKVACKQWWGRCRWLVWASGVKLWGERRATRRVVHLRPWLFPTVPKGCPYLVDHYLGARGKAPCLSDRQNIDQISTSPCDSERCNVDTLSIICRCPRLLTRDAANYFASAKYSEYTFSAHPLTLFRKAHPCRHTSPSCAQPNSSHSATSADRFRTLTGHAKRRMPTQTEPTRTSTATAAQPK